MENKTTEFNSPPTGRSLFPKTDGITVKLIIIGVLTLLLLIPSSWINHLIDERQERAASVVQEVSEKWSGQQTLTSPILVIPYVYKETIKHSKDDIEVIEKTNNAFFLPETFSVNGDVTPQVLHRGIFDAVVYSSAMEFKAQFAKPDFSVININENQVQWDKAQLIIGITDIGGINATPVIQVGNRKLESQPTSDTGVRIKSYKGIASTDEAYSDSYQPTQVTSNGIIAHLKGTSADDFIGTTTIKLELRGSQRLNFVPSGKETSVTLKGSGADPSFDGEFLPVDRQTSEDEFSATWKISHFNRPFAQQWTGSGQELTSSDFGLKLLVPVDQYQKSIRTSKYAHLIIILTFVALFLVEITSKIKIHPFQYVLIGAALIIYYTLLLSIAEQLGFNPAYWIATLATVSLVGLYANSFIKSRALVILFSGIMSMFYAFIFVIILQQDLSLLIGSVGLFLVLASIMFFSRKISWYKESVS